MPILHPTSLAFRAAALAQQTGEAFIWLARMTHPNLTDDIRVTSDSVDVVSRGETYLHFPFMITPPSDEEDAPPIARLQIDNVNREIVVHLESIPVDNPPRVYLELVLASNPDLVEVQFPKFRLTNARYDVLRIEGDLTVQLYHTTKYPKQRFLPSNHPGMFLGVAS